jgi:hypothetical protein
LSIWACDAGENQHAPAQRERIRQPATKNRMGTRLSDINPEL